MAKTIDSLTEEVFQEFGDRKIPGRLDLVYNIDSGKYYPVPKGIEHKDFTPTLEGDPDRMIPVQFRFYSENGKRILKEFLVGASSYEAETNVRHTRADLKEAYEQTFSKLLADTKIVPERFEIIQTFVKKK